MHGYGTDSSERRIVPLLLALLAIALAGASSKFLASAPLSFPCWVDAPRRNGNGGNGLRQGDADDLARLLSSWRFLWRARTGNLWPDLLEEDLDACLEGGLTAKGRRLGREGRVRKWKKRQKLQVPT